MKLLLDQGLPRSTIYHLRALGITAEHVGDLGMSRATDADILSAAQDRNAVVVTLDADFHALLARAGATSPSAIRIRREGLKGDELAQILAQVVEAAGSELEAGAVVSVDPVRIRVRSLPIAPSS